MNISLSEFDFYSQSIDLDLTHFVMKKYFSLYMQDKTI